MNYEEIFSDIGLQYHERMKAHYDYDGIVNFPEYVVMNDNTRCLLNGDRSSLYFDGLAILIDMTMKDGEVKVL